ncbi:MAG: glycoside hydrolase family 32 protein [Leucobacter sp.]
MNSLHFSPRRNWMNDPNGLLFHDGRYHLYFQYNPLGVGHENMSWGHASSADLVTWQEHPVAISFDDDEEVFSGSIVVDVEGTTGFGTPGDPALIALYTSDSKREKRQAQSIAYSLDAGTSWAKYEGNPVLDRGSANFRDPKIIRWESAEECYWVMVAVEAEDRQVVMYRSDDLLSWRYLSSFGPEGAVGGVWECPDLFPLRIEGTDEERWILILSLSPGGLAGGSGTQYFVGEFDGRVFKPDTSHPPVDSSDTDGMRSLDWLDYGRDCYAGVTFAGLPNDQRTLIAWMSNWDYARQSPVSEEAPQRGSMTLARRLSLVSADSAGGRLRLRQTPVVPPTAETARLEGVAVQEGSDFALGVPARGRVEIAIDVDEAAGVVLRLEEAGDFAGPVGSGDVCEVSGAVGSEGACEVGDSGARAGAQDPRRDTAGAVLISYDVALGELSCDRRGSARGYPEEFASVERMPVALSVGTPTVAQSSAAQSSAAQGSATEQAATGPDAADLPSAPASELVLTLWLDEGSIEIFAEGGTRVLTDLTAPLRSPRLTVSGTAGSVRIVRLVAAEAVRTGVYLGD